MLAAGERRSERAAFSKTGFTVFTPLIVKMITGKMPCSAPNATLADSVSPKTSRMIG